MAKTTDYRTGAAEWDGKLPFVYQSGSITSVNGTVNGAVFVAPCDCEVVDFNARILTTATNAAVRLSMGIIGALTRNLASYNIQNLTGVVSVPLASFASLTFTKGEPMLISLVNADTTGVLAVDAVCMPR